MGDVPSQESQLETGSVHCLRLLLKPRETITNHKPQTVNRDKGRVVQGEEP